MLKINFSNLRLIFPLFVLVICSMELFGQSLPKGVTRLGSSLGKTNFIFEDSKNNIWSSSFFGGNRNLGLYLFANNKWTTVYNEGVFTDAIEKGSKIYFSASNGLYTYDDSTMEIDKSITQNSCVVLYKNNLLVGSIGNGLWWNINDTFRRIPVKINDVSFDSIFCLKTEGNLLWIGTSNGLVKYDGSKFTKFDLPIVPKTVMLANSNQRTVLSIQKDKNNRIWVVTKNQLDSIDCLYFLEKDSFVSARKYYYSSCFFRNLIPFKANKINLSTEGNIIMGMNWGVLEFGENIKPFVVGDIYSWVLNVSNNSSAFVNNQGKMILNMVGNVGSEGFFIIDPNLYELESLVDLFYMNRINFNTIDINDIKVTTANDGTMFNGMDIIELFLDKPTFNIPSLSCAKPMFSSALWIGGYDESNNNLHVAAQTYRQNGSDYLPGPIDLVTKKYDSTANSFYNKIWKIDRRTIDEFKLNYAKPFYTIPNEILDWPAHGKGNFTKNLAPFVDNDGNGLYEPTKGDYPKIKGDQMLWWVFNDLGLHGETNGNSLKMEIHGSCYAYYHNKLLQTDTNGLVNRTIFFDYKFINRSDNNYKELYTGIWNDVDLGFYRDDYVGCDTMQNVGFGYNGDNWDETQKGFGKNPPIILCKFLNQKMTNFISYDNDFSVFGNPERPEHYYSYLRSSFKNGSTIHFLNQGYPCNNPYNINKKPFDRRFLMSTNTPSLKKDSTFEVEFAYVFLHKPDVDLLKEGCDEPFKNLQRIQNWYDNNSFPSKPYNSLSSKNVEVNSKYITVYPNPTNSKINVFGNIGNRDIKSIEIIDYSGKTMFQQSSFNKNDTMNLCIDVGNLASGLYFVKVSTTKEIFIKKIVKQ